MLKPEELHIRAALFRSIRSFFFRQHFLEVDTPIRQPVIIPESNIQPLLSEGFFLQTSPELCMKRLVASGCDKIFQICPCFRREERGRRHLEEFSMLEWYRCRAGYADLMTDCENLLTTVVAELHRCFPRLETITSTTSPAIGQCELMPPWQRLKVADAFRQWSPLTMEEALMEGRFDEMLVEFIEPRLGLAKPTFLYDYPAALAALARKKIDDPAIAERFELYIHGIELANGFSELTDPIEQRQRFAVELELLQQRFSLPMSMPERFLKDLEQLGETAGIALGLDRLFMIILAKTDINGAVTFSPLDL